MFILPGCLLPSLRCLRAAASAPPARAGNAGSTLSPGVAVAMAAAASQLGPLGETERLVLRLSEEEVRGAAASHQHARGARGEVRGQGRESSGQLVGGLGGKRRSGLEGTGMAMRYGKARAQGATRTHLCVMSSVFSLLAVIAWMRANKESDGGRGVEGKEAWGGG